MVVYYPALTWRLLLSSTISSRPGISARACWRRAFSHTGQAGIFGIADQAAFASATFMGLFIGASLLAPLADKLGRRLTFGGARLVRSFSLLMATQSSAEGDLLPLSGGDRPRH